MQVGAAQLVSAPVEAARQPSIADRAVVFLGNDCGLDSRGSASLLLTLPTLTYATDTYFLILHIYLLMLLLTRLVGSWD